jgi:hypothetical protein
MGLFLISPFIAEAQGIPPSEEILIRLFELFLTYLTVLLAVIGVVFVLLQIWFQWRQKSFQTQIETFMTNSSNLISTTDKMMQISSKGQEDVLQIKQHMEIEKKERENEIRELEFDTISFIATHGRFDLNRQELEKIMEHISMVERKTGITNLPIEAFLIKGYFRSVIQSSYEWGIEEFNKVIEKETLLKPRALLNRGINRANLNDYDGAIDDIQNAIKSRQGNILYEFYLLDTKLLKSRKEKAFTGKPELQNELLAKLEDLFNRCMQPTAPDLGEGMKLSQLQIRIGTDLASLLIWECNKSILDVNAVLDTVPQVSLILFLKLECKNKYDTIPDTDSLLNQCIKMLSQDYAGSIESKSKILRGLSLAQCYSWKKDRDALNDIKIKLRGDTDILKQTIGEKVTIFSPISRKNESAVEIIKQIDAMN